MIATLIAVGATYLLALIGGVWYLGRELGTLKQCVKNLPTMRDLNGKIIDHQDRCPAYRAETSGVSTIPPVPR